MGGEDGEVVDGVGEDGEVGKVVDGVILSSSSSSKFVGNEDRETECAERGRKKETKTERPTEICHQVDRSVSERVESKVGNDSIGMLLQR